MILGTDIWTININGILVLWGLWIAFRIILSSLRRALRESVEDDFWMFEMKEMHEREKKIHE